MKINHDELLAGLNDPSRLISSLLAEQRAEHRAAGLISEFDDKVNMPLCVAIYKFLEREYPNNYWSVEVFLEKGKIEIFAKHLDVNSIYINPLDIVNDPTFAVIKREVGEFLERYGLARGKANLDHTAALVEDMPDPMLRKDQRQGE